MPTLIKQSNRMEPNMRDLEKEGKLEEGKDLESDKEDNEPLQSILTNTSALNEGERERERETESTSQPEVVGDSQSGKSKTSSSEYKVSQPKESHFFLLNCFQQMLDSKSIKRFPDIKEDVEMAYDLVKSTNFSKSRAMEPHNIDLILAPLINCCTANSQTLSLIALDGLSKLISFEYLSNQVQITSDRGRLKPPIERAVLAICACFTGEATPEKVQTQVIKCLMSAVTSTAVPLHQEALLNAVRTLYNIFLLSHDVNNQIISQGTLLQMSRAIFSRIQTVERKQKNGYRAKGLPQLPRSNHAVLDELDREDRYGENDVNEEDKNSAPNPLSLEAIGGKAAEAAANAQVQGNIDDTKSDLNVLDAFLLFRALCKLSIKPYQADGSSDVRCMSLRSKLLSLYLILIILHEFHPVFFNATVFFLTPSNSDSPRRIREVAFLEAVKPYFCLCLSRNLVSNLPKVYELAMAVFELVLVRMRSVLKREIEVFLKEIIVPILEMKPVGNQHQKHILLSMFLRRVCNDPQILVEIYLNYDCDKHALNSNIFESIIRALSKMTGPPRPIEVDEMGAYLWDEPETYCISTQTMDKTDLINLPPLTSDRFSGYFTLHSFFNRSLFTDIFLQKRSLDCLVGVLKSLMQWSDRGLNYSEGFTESRSSTSNSNENPTKNTFEANRLLNSSPNSIDFNDSKSYIETKDDPSQFEKEKDDKQKILKSVELFNIKPKKGIASLIQHEIIENDNPETIARYLSETKELDLTMIGEYLGELENTNIMHAFVDLMDFSELEFVAAMRVFLKKFRLPGEAQKIDRFMLKFSQRYKSQNPTMFNSADTAYVLAYSIIMLNTDLHNPQVKRRMTKEEFLKNNSKIDDGKDLDHKFLETIYDQILNDEIQLKDDESPEGNKVIKNSSSSSLPSISSSLAAQFDLLGQSKKEFERSQSMSQSMRMQTKAERYLKKLVSRKSYGQDIGGMAIFYSASHFEHVRPMFTVSWMAFLAAISGPLKESDDDEIIRLCLEGFSYAIHISGFFDLELARNAFVTTLGNFSFLSDINEMKPKNIRAIKAMLDIAVTEGNYLKGAWQEVLQVMNHLVRLQLVPNFSATTNGRDRSLIAHRDAHSRPFANIALLEGNSQAMLIAVDRVFASTVHLNGPAITDFCKALCELSWAELKSIPNSFDSSRTKTSPKMFSVQKLVEVAYYNMNRIRLEWIDIWKVVGPLFNQMGSHRHEVIASFAIDSLRQLAMKFLEKKELSHFGFQRVFMRPFVFIIKNNPAASVKEMVLQCIDQIIKTHSKNLASGWLTIFEVLGTAAHDHLEKTVYQAYDITQSLLVNKFETVIAQPQNFAGYIDAVAQFTMNAGFEKLGLSALEMFKDCADRMIEYMEDIMDRDPEEANLFYPILKEELQNYSGEVDDFQSLNHWKLIFFTIMRIITSVFNWKIRTRAIDILFTYLHEHGTYFTTEFWALILDQILFPLFSNLGKMDSSIKLQFSSREDSFAWVSSTLSTSLKKFVILFTEYYDKVFIYLNGLLDLISVCLCQDHPAMIQIGSECMIMLVEKNVDRLKEDDWFRLLSILLRLFQASSRIQHANNSVKTTFNDRKNTSEALKKLLNEEISPLPLIPQTATQQLHLCIKTIQLVETTFLEHPQVFSIMPGDYIFAILDMIELAYQEAQQLNQKFDLKECIEKQAITKIERFSTTSLALELNALVGLVKVLLKMYTSEDMAYTPYKHAIELRLIPLIKDTFHNFNELSQYPLGPGLNEMFELWHQVTLRIGTFLTVANYEDFKTLFSPSSYEIIRTLKHHHLTQDIRDMLFKIMVRVDCLFIHDKEEANNQDQGVVLCKISQDMEEKDKEKEDSSSFTSAIDNVD